MKIEILETRNYAAIGMKQKGQVVNCPDNIAQQFISQGFARMVESEPPRTMEVKKRDTVSVAMQMGAQPEEDDK